MMSVIELAVQLGKALKEDKRLLKLNETREAYENNERVATLSTEYEVQQKAMQLEAMKEDRNEELMKMIQDRIDAIYNQIIETEEYKALEKAQEDVNELMNMVNETISFQIRGEEASACTHNCSTCGGCH